MPQLGICFAGRAPIRCVEPQRGRSRWPQADRWIRGRSAAGVRTHRRATARGLQPAAPRLLGAACCWALGVWSLCPLCSLWFLSAAAEAEQPQRTQRVQSRAEEGRGGQGKRRGGSRATGNCGACRAAWPSATPTP